MSADHVAPHNLPAEERVLGAMLLSERAVSEVAAVLDASDFYRETHATIYRAALDLVASGSPVDTITLANFLDQRGELEKVGGTAKIAELAAIVPAASNAVHYARIVSGLAIEREVKEIGLMLSSGTMDAATAEAQLAGLRPRAERRSDAMGTWQPLNLADLPERDPVRPDLGGIGLVYPGKRHLFSGPYESAKTIAAYCVGIAVAGQGRRVILIDFEMGGWDARERLRELGATDDEFALISYVAPEDAATDEDIDRLLALDPALVIIDAAAGLFDLYDLNDERRKEVERLHRLIIEPFHRKGVASIVIDHVTKSGDHDYAIGSERKVTGFDVHLRFTAKNKIVRGGSGLFHIKCLRDRQGHLPRKAPANLRLSSDPHTHRITWAFDLPWTKPEMSVAPRYMESVSLFLEETGPSMRTAIYEGATGARQMLVRAVEWLLVNGYARQGEDDKIELVKLFRSSDAHDGSEAVLIDPATDVPSSTVRSPSVPARSEAVPNPAATSVPEPPPPKRGRDGERGSDTETNTPDSLLPELALTPANQLRLPGDDGYLSHVIAACDARDNE